MTTKEDLEDLEALRATARMLAQDLFGSEPKAIKCRESEPCMTREEKRGNGHPRLPEMALQRSFDFYDPARLCVGCRAYWFAERCAQELDFLVARTRREIAADEPSDAA